MAHRFDFPFIRDRTFEAESIRARDWHTLDSINDARVNSTGSISGPSTSSVSTRKSTIIAIAEGRGIAKGEIGIAAMDAIGSTVYLSQFPDAFNYSRLFTKLEVLDPSEVILPATCGETSTKNFLDLLLNYNNKITVTKLERKYFNDVAGLKAVTNVCNSEYKNKLEIEVKEKYYCLAAVAALLKYVEWVQNMIFSPNSIKVVYTGSEQTISIDPSTAKSLELIVNQQTGKTQNTLFGFLDYTKTKVGYRLLRATIREPSRDLQTIEPRYDLISEILATPDFHFNTSEIIAKFSDLECIIHSLISEPRSKEWKVGETRIEVLIFLRHNLELIQPLREQLGRTQHSIFQHYYNLLDDPNYDDISDIINQVISSDCRLVNGALNIKHKKVFAIRQEIDGFLDSKRVYYNRMMEDMSNYAEQLSNKYNMPIKLSQNTPRGYHLTLNLNERPDLNSHLPPEFLRVLKRGKIVSFTTLDMMQMDGHTRLALEDIFKTSYEILWRIFQDIREKVGCLHKLTEIVALLDLLLSFSYVSSKFNMSRPDFDTTMAIKSGCHPFLLESNKMTVVRNDTFLSEDCNIRILRGPNMSGKSTYLKQICILQIMAQCGCFVPAERATFRLTDQIFTRVGHNDEIETNCSTFTNEMKEMKYILDTYTDSSLIIIDELGKGTSYEEGLAVCWAVLESFLESKAFVLTATHYSALTEMDSMYPNVLTQFFNEDHKLTENDDPNPLYGLKMAETAGLPPEIIENAKRIANSILESSNANNPATPGPDMREKFQIGRHLLTLAKKPNLNIEVLNKYLRYFKAAQRKLQSKNCSPNGETTSGEVGADSNSGHSNIPKNNICIMSGDSHQEVNLMDNEPESDNQSGDDNLSTASTLPRETP